MLIILEKWNYNSGEIVLFNDNFPKINSDAKGFVTAQTDTKVVKHHKFMTTC